MRRPEIRVHPGFTDDHFYRKRGRVARFLARDLLTHAIGDRIGRIQDYASVCETGFGTVQEALRDLVDAGAVLLEARGHLGTFVTAIDYRRLWELAGIGRVLGLMPLPYSRRYEGLATGLYECFRSHALQFSLGYMRGARDRLTALTQGQCSFAITSRLAAEMAAGEHRVSTLFDFGPQTYVGRHALLLRPGLVGGLRDGMRVGADSNSPDQQWLTMRECEGCDVTIVETAYTQILRKLHEGQIDAAVWSIDEVPASLGLAIVPLRQAAVDDAAERNTEAVLVVSDDRPELVTILRQVIDPAQIVKVQTEVIDGQRLPSY